MTMPTCQKDVWSPWHEGWTDEERSPRLRDFEIMLKNLFPFAIFVPCRPVWSMDPNGPIFFIQMREDSPKESHGTNLEYTKYAISCHGQSDTVHNGFCPSVKLTFKDLAKLTAFAAIFKTKSYFRWDIWGSLFIQFHFLSHIRFSLHIFLSFNYFR